MLFYVRLLRLCFLGWVLCFYYLLSLHRKKIFSCMAVGFLVHMKSTRVSKMFQRNKSRQHWLCSVGTVYIIWSYGISVLITNLDLMTLLAEKTPSLIQWLLSNSDKSDLCPTHSPIDKFAHFWTIISSIESIRLIPIEQGTRKVPFYLMKLDSKGRSEKESLPYSIW